MAKKEAYRLQALLEIRERTKKEKEEELAKAQKKLQEEKQKLEELRKQLEDMKAHLLKKQREYAEQISRGGMIGSLYNRADRHLKFLEDKIQKFEEEEIKEQEKRIAFAQQEVDWAHEELLQAMQEYKALEKHKEKWLEQQKKEMMAKQELQEEEIATTIFLFKNQ